VTAGIAVPAADSTLQKLMAKHHSLEDVASHYSISVFELKKVLRRLEMNTLEVFGDHYVAHAEFTDFAVKLELATIRSKDNRKKKDADRRAKEKEYTLAGKAVERLKNDLFNLYKVLPADGSKDYTRKE
jgi:hypothetical protein